MVSLTKSRVSLVALLGVGLLISACHPYHARYYGQHGPRHAVVQPRPVPVIRPVPVPAPGHRRHHKY